MSGSHLPCSRESCTQCFMGNTNNAEHPHSGVTPGHFGMHIVGRMSSGDKAFLRGACKEFQFPFGLCPLCSTSC